MANEDADRLIHAFSRDPHRSPDLTRYARTPQHIQTILDNNLGNFYVAKSASKMKIPHQNASSLIDTYGIGETNVLALEKGFQWPK